MVDLSIAMLVHQRVSQKKVKLINYHHCELVTKQHYYPNSGEDISTMNIPIVVGNIINYPIVLLRFHRLLRGFRAVSSSSAGGIGVGGDFQGALFSRYPAKPGTNVGNHETWKRGNQEKCGPIAKRSWCWNYWIIWIWILPWWESFVFLLESCDLGFQTSSFWSSVGSSAVVPTFWRISPWRIS